MINPLGSSAVGLVFSGGEAVFLQAREICVENNSTENGLAAHGRRKYAVLKQQGLSGR